MQPMQDTLFQSVAQLKYWPQPRGHRFESGLEVPAYDIGGDDNVGGGDGGEAGQGRDEVGEGGELRLRHRGGASATSLHIK